MFGPLIRCRVTATTFSGLQTPENARCDETNPAGSELQLFGNAVLVPFGNTAEITLVSGSTVSSFLNRYCHQSSVTCRPPVSKMPPTLQVRAVSGFSVGLPIEVTGM